MKKKNGKFKEYVINVKDPNVFFLMFCKICENTGFRRTVLPRIRTVSTILSLNKKIKGQRKPVFSHILQSVRTNDLMS